MVLAVIFADWEQGGDMEVAEEEGDDGFSWRSMCQAWCKRRHARGQINCSEH